MHHATTQHPYPSNNSPIQSETGEGVRHDNFSAFFSAMTELVRIIGPWVNIAVNREYFLTSACATENDFHFHGYPVNTHRVSGRGNDHHNPASTFTTGYDPFATTIVSPGLCYDGITMGLPSCLYDEKVLQDDFGLDWYDYGARFYDAQIARFHTVDPLAEVYSFQSPFAYAANNPIYYIDYMGLGPRKWWENFKGWVNTRILGKTHSGNHHTVQPERETRTVVYSKEYNMTPRLHNWSNFNLYAFLRGDPDDGLGWVRDYLYYSSFDESYRSNIRAQGVRFNERPLPGREVRQVWQRRPVTGRARILIGPNDRGRLEVREHIKRFLGLNMGNRTHIAFYGLNPPRTRVGNLTHEEINLMIENRILLEVTPRHYYQQVLRLHGTRAYFEELERAGIIEPMNANPQ